MTIAGRIASSCECVSLESDSSSKSLWGLRERGGVAAGGPGGLASRLCTGVTKYGCARFGCMTDTLRQASEALSESELLFGEGLS